MICIDPWTYLIAAALLLLLPARWLLSALLAAALHELAHLTAIRIVGGRIDRVRIGSHGAKIETVLPGNWQELFCAAAGPAASLSLLFLCPVAPRLALCGLIQGVFNLLPIYPLDGGRMLRCLLCRAFPEKGEKISEGIGTVLSGGLLSVAMLCCIWHHWGIFPLLALGFGLYRLLCGKNSCKNRGNAVQ